MILHVGGLDKFLPPFISLVNEEFPSDSHEFWFTDSQGKFPAGEDSNVYIAKNTVVGKLVAYALLVIKLHRCRKVVLHGLFNNNVIRILAFFPWLLPKCYWVMWGGDLYRYQQSKDGFKSKFNEAFRAFVISRVGHLVTYIEGDVELAKKWYGTRGIYHECLMYPSNVFDPAPFAKSVERSDQNGLSVLVGNSADPSNNHIEVFEQLLPFKDKDIKIFVPLSYGDEDYAEEVIKLGSEWFGDKFIPLIEFMPFAQYLEFLTSLDIAIFNHQRQQAMGNTITLLGLGKTVYLRSDVSQWDLFEKEGIKVSDIGQFELAVLNSQILCGNVEQIKKRFSRENLIKQYCEIFQN